MNITYDLTVELKGDAGITSWTEPLVFHNVDDLKSRLSEDYASEDYRIYTLDITIDEHTEISFSFPCNMRIYALCDYAKIQCFRSDTIHISDLYAMLDEYARIDD